MSESRTYREFCLYCIIYHCSLLLFQALQRYTNTFLTHETCCLCHGYTSITFSINQKETKQIPLLNQWKKIMFSICLSKKKCLKDCEIQVVYCVGSHRHLNWSGSRAAAEDCPHRINQYSVFFFLLHFDSIYTSCFYIGYFWNYIINLIAIWFSWYSWKSCVKYTYKTDDFG